MITSPPKRGMALVVVLVLLAVMMLVTITLSGRMQQQLGRTRSQQEYQQALWYSASAESLALSALSLSLKNEKRVHLAQPWASGPRFFPLPQGQIAVTRATVAPDWMSIPCGFMACDAQRVICRIDECRGWSAGLALAPVMFRAQLNEQDLPLSLTVVGIAPEKLSAWAGADAERLTVTALPAITTYGEPEGNLLTGPWQPRVSYRKQWARWRVMILPILLILVALAVERGVTLWSVSEQVAQSRTQAEEQFLTLFPEQKRIVNLRSQVTMALKKYRPQADDTRLLAELSAIASTLKSASLSDIEMRGFTFDQKRQTLHLQLRAANFASFDKLRSALATDYVVQQDALQKEGDAVSGGVTLRRK
ncbi:TPA: type II secretion system protein GspL [Escherichia coli]